MVGPPATAATFVLNDNVVADLKGETLHLGTATP